MNVELLAPAGNTEALDAAIGEGADAVYLGLKSFNARMRSSNFSWSQFEAAVNTLHKRGKKIYVTVNTVITEEETERMYRFLSYLNSVQPDAVIVQDLGVVQMIKDYFPKLKIHASTQMNIASAKAANVMSKSGVSRVVLARELSLEEITAINYATSCEVEVFTHGALCVSQSGLCMFSSYLGGKSANRGMCTQACRRIYSAHTEGGDKKGYFFSPYDLQLIDFVPALAKAGIASIKIEGRMKSAEYVGTVVAAYRHVLDNWEKDEKAAAETGRRILANDFARKKTQYYFISPNAENVLNPEQAGGAGIFLGTVAETKTFKETGGAEIIAEKDGEQRKTVYAMLKGGEKYSPVTGDSIRLHKKNDSGRESWKLQDVKVFQGKTWLQIPAEFSSGDFVYLLQTKSMSKRYPQVLPKSLSAYRRQPGDEKLPVLKFLPESNDSSFSVQTGSAEKEEKGSDVQAQSGTGFKSASKKRSLSKRENPDIFPEGIYVQLSSLKNIGFLTADKPARIILNLNEEVAAGLEEAQVQGKALPFPKREIFISLDPFLPQEKEALLETQLENLIIQGFKTFIVNNLAHITMLKSKSVNIIAGQYLYTFNRRAVQWLRGNKIYRFVSPIENSQTNLENTFDPVIRSSVLIPVFSYPALFRMRFTLPKNYDFLYFSDKQDGMFKAFSTPSASFVLPEKPFSITDKTSALEKKGFKKFLIDFSHTAIERSEYRYIMNACRNSSFVEDTSRFNWKEGFYDPVKVEELKNFSSKENDRQKLHSPRKENRFAASKKEENYGSGKKHVSYSKKYKSKR